MSKKWHLLEPPQDKEISALANELKVDRIIASILLKRGIGNFQQAETFFRPTHDQMNDSFLMKNMETAVSLIQKAIDNQEKVLLYGDYDVDGTTSVAMMYTFLESKIKDLLVYVPDRYSEGYGVSEKAIDWAIEEKVNLIVTLDCGIKNPDELNKAKKAGIEILICDHHEPGDDLPDAVILNPKQKDCNYPFKELCGCGVAYKLLQAFSKNTVAHQSEIDDLLDFVAIATGADIVSVLGENRIFCNEGLKLLNSKGRACFDALLNVAGKSKPVNLTDVVFMIAPRINAAGRIYQAKTAVDLMISKNQEEISRLAKEIQAFNVERRVLDEQTTKEALEQILGFDDFETKKSTIVNKEGWSKGVVGIVASRLIERHFRPTIVLAEENGLLTGSARTVNDFDIHAALSLCSDLFVKFGGHTHAAGLTLQKENLEAFKVRFEEIVSKGIDLEDQLASIVVDQEINFDEIFKPGEDFGKLPRLKRILDQMEPYGPGNLNPLFVTRNVYASQCKILKEKHLKLTVCQPTYKLEIPAIAFNLSDKIDEVASGLPFDIVYSLEENTWNNKTTLQLNIRDIRAAV
jgi:single-stranded-DNA-specific exonuclease